MSDSVELSGVEETLMIPLWGRAIATQGRGLFHDPAAVDLVERLEYDFESKLNQARTIMPMLAVRAARFDEAVRHFIDTHPDGAVVELGCGLDTRWERCNGNRVDWFDLDMPAVIALRRRYFQDSERRKTLAAPLQDTAWRDLVGPKERPFLFVAEAVLYYLERVRLFFIEDFSPYSWALLPADASPQWPFREGHQAGQRVPASFRQPAEPRHGAEHLRSSPRQARSLLDIRAAFWYGAVGREADLRWL